MTMASGALRSISASPDLTATVLRGNVPVACTSMPRRASAFVAPDRTAFPNPSSW